MIISYIICWEYFSHFERHNLVQLKKFQNIIKLILGSVIFLIMGVCFFRISNHAVLLGRPVSNLYKVFLLFQEAKNEMMLSQELAAEV